MRNEGVGGPYLTMHSGKKLEGCLWNAAWSSVLLEIRAGNINPGAQSRYKNGATVGGCIVPHAHTL